MKFQKTVKVSVPHRTTDKKLSYLDNLKARLTYAVHLFRRMLKENDRVPEYRSDVREFSDHVKEETDLSAGFVQQAEDKVLWVYKQYKRSHDKWEWAMDNAREGTRWYRKLEERELSVPNPEKSELLEELNDRIAHLHVSEFRRNSSYRWDLHSNFSREPGSSRL